MYDPQQAVKDYHNTKFIVLVFVLTISVYVLVSTLGTGIKYILLTHTGVKSEASVTKITDERGRNFDLLSNNSLGLTNDVFVHLKHTIEGKGEFAGKFFAKCDIEYVNGERRYVAPYKIGEEVSIVYSRYYPDIVLTTSEFPKFSTDRNLMLGSLGTVFVFGILLFSQIKIYREFRRKSRYY